MTDDDRFRDSEYETAEGGLLEASLTIETPERVEIVYDLAGIGSRFAAALVDVCLLGMVWFILFIIATFVELWGLSLRPEDLAVFGMAAVGSLAAIWWFYYLGFELFWEGRTPGKHMLRLRVVSDSGGPAPASALIVRNILRLVDMIPYGLPFVLGGIIMFLNGKSKRIGDYGGGTVVVRERAVDLSLHRFRPDAGVRTGTSDELNEEEQELVERFLMRRKTLRPGPRVELASQLAARLSDGRDLPEMDPETLLRLLHQGHTPAQIRDAAGPAGSIA